MNEDNACVGDGVRGRFCARFPHWLMLSLLVLVCLLSSAVFFSSFASAAAQMAPPPEFIPPPPEDEDVPLSPPLYAQIAEYEVQPGDTVEEIAHRFETDPETLAVINEMDNWHRIFPGDTIYVINVRGLLHEVSSEDTVEEVAEQYNVNLEDLLAANGLKPSEQIEKGDKLVVPGARAPQEAVLAARGELFRWPTRGRITSYFGYRWGSFHQGIDIAAATGTPVGASRTGTVSRAGWAGGYGNLIEIDHHDGKTTRYAHLSNIHVRVGQRVERGQIIGRVGSTGRSTGPHLHFEIREGGRARNPLDYLPR